MTRVVLSVFAGAVFSMYAGLGAQDPASNLPDGEGKAVVVRVCANCHELDKVTSKRETEAGWTPIVRGMVALGAQATEQEQLAVAAYLGKYFGRDGVAASQVQVPAPAPVQTPAQAPGSGPVPGAAQASATGQASAVNTRAYEVRCGSCHGPTMTGGNGPANLAYVRYHSDAEVTAVIRNGRPKMPPLQIPDDELRQILAAIRALAGTNPAMATAGFTGRRGGGPGQLGTPTPPAAGGSTSVGGRGTSSLKLADGRTLSGIVMAQSELDATVLADGRFHLLARDGDVYREKPIAPKRDWLGYDGAPSGNRYSTLAQINTATVRRLAPAWVFPMPSSPRLEGTPTVVDGIMYMTGWNEVYALDATTGRQLWMYSEPHTEGILSEGGSGANRGVTISGDRIFAVTDRAHILAFNRFTGEKLWDVEMGSFKDSYSATGTPLVVGDLVISGTAGGEEGARGFIDAYRVATGERAWRFWTIPKRGEKGSETWIGQALEHGCGVAWLTGSYDPKLDLLYWAAGNPCPDMSGEERMGDNLYTDSVLALSPKTGELKWYYQFTPHDTHDWDAVQPLVLADEMWQGRPRKLLLQGNRNGFFYVLDRTNGEVLLHEPFVGKQTWNLGFTKDGKPIINPASVSTPEGSAVCPGSGANWPAVSYNPLTKLFYVRAADSCTIATSHVDPLGASGTRWFGRGNPSEKAQQALAALQADYPGGNFIRAIDPFTGKKVWDYPAPTGRGGVLSTAGGLVFVGGAGGLMALNAKTGKPAWHVNLGQTSTSTAMTYMVGGTQYIALPGTGTLVSYRLH